MNRAAFLKRMAFAALACGFLDVERLLPEPQPSPTAWITGSTYKLWQPEPLLAIGDMVGGDESGAVGVITEIDYTPGDVAITIAWT